MKTFKTLSHLEKRLQKGICWGDWIKVSGKEYKMTEYGGENDNYILFQNKPTKDTIEIHYACPTFNGGDQTRHYEFRSLEKYECSELYRY